jgi:UDP-N-acetylglucosamine transferase subunit ALG13
VIFVTIGSMFPFDRLIRVMDAWAEAHGGQEMLAQIGAGAYEPAHMPWVRRLDQEAFGRQVAEARLIVAHAGMGSVITAGQAGRPIVLLPRLRAWGEHTTDHQLATANWLRGKPGIYVADRDADLGPRIAEALAAEDRGQPLIPPVAPAAFIARIRQCILE